MDKQLCACYISKPVSNTDYLKNPKTSQQIFNDMKEVPIVNNKFLDMIMLNHDRWWYNPTFIVKKKIYMLHIVKHEKNAVFMYQNYLKKDEDNSFAYVQSRRMIKLCFE